MEPQAEEASYRLFLFFYLFIFKGFIYLFDRERDHKQAEREEEAGSLLSREPDAGLDPRTLGS